jgi:putative ABC transport system permease protein
MPDWRALVRERLRASGAAEGAGSESVDEIAQHLADVYQMHLRRGVAEADAIALAEAELARTEPLSDAVRRREQKRLAHTHNPSGGGALRSLSGDIRQALRLFSHRPGFTALVVSTLAIGLGATTTVFSLFNALLLRPLPYPDPDRLVLLWEYAGDPTSPFIVAAPVYEDWRRENQSLQSLGVWEYMTFNLAADGEAAQIRGVRASASLFDVLGVAPARGRLFTAADDAPGHRVAVISDAVWRTQFGSDPSVIGRSFLLNDASYEVSAVMPPGFEFPESETGVWVPIAFTKQDQQRGSHSFYVAARLKPDVTFAQAQTDIGRIGRSLAERYESNREEGSVLMRMSEYGVLRVQRILTVLSGAVALVLLIACVNVASLQLGLGLARRREFVLRLALGARIRRIAQQLLCESLVLATAGALSGLALAWTATRAVDLALSPGFRTLPFRGSVPVTIDGSVLAFATMAAVVSAALFGLWPLASLRRAAPQALLREGERGATRLAGGLRRALVTVELALAIVVLCSAGLMIRSLGALLQVPPGVDTSSVLTMQLSLPQDDTFGAPVRTAFCTNVKDSLEALPGIRQASAISHLPLGGANSRRGFVIEGHPAPRPGEPGGADFRVACPGYFATLGIPLAAGRDFAATDVRDSEPVLIISRATADLFWRGEDPVGKRVKFGGFQSDNPWYTVIGVVENVRHFALDQVPRPEIYRPYSQAAWPVMAIVAKTAGEPMAWERSVRDALRRVDPGLPAADARSMDQIVMGSVSWRETPLRLLSGFAVIGLVLAALGVYGVLGYYVAQRTRELGVRIALGATRAAIVALVLRQSMLPIVVGLVLGVAGAIGASQLLTTFLYDVRPTDPRVISAVSILLVVVGIVASWLPARRAAMVDPLAALREE